MGVLFKVADVGISGSASRNIMPAFGVIADISDLPLFRFESLHGLTVQSNSYRFTRVKLSRGKFSAAFMLACLSAIEAMELRL